VAARAPRDTRDGRGEIVEHELCTDADEAKAGALQLAITALIRAWLTREWHRRLDDELDAGRQEVSDEEPEDGHSTEGDRIA
jgi:hypothetical protein